MARRTFKAEFNDLEFIIKEDKSDVGWYLYVIKDKTVIEDYLQDSLDLCKDDALEYYSVPLDIWHPVDYEIYFGNTI